MHEVTDQRVWTGADVIAALQERGLLSAAGLDRVRRLEAETGERADRIAAKLGVVSDRDLAHVYATLLGAPLLTDAEFPAAPVAAGQIAPGFLHGARVLPVSDSAATLVLAMADPLDEATVRAVAFAVRKTVLRRAAIPAEIEAAHARLYGTAEPAPLTAAAWGEDDRDTDLERLRDSASDAPVIRLVNALITRAVEMGASDIHLESMENRMRVRYRIDGVLREVEAPPAPLRHAVISRVKILANLNIAERRLAQDGRIRLAIRGQEMDFRVSTTPSVHGESVVLRILDRGRVALDFAALGFDADLIVPFREALHRPHGIVLVTGPTGSGKTTTLYTALTELNTVERKILSVEDPVEYLLDGVNQVQVKPEIGQSFAAALRSFLRQDPDIMMIGEIRDLETAQIAVQAALTGHLVLSTVHTNDAASAITRLQDMGIEDYLLTSTINVVLAQRLVRCLCTACRQARPLSADLADRLGLRDPAGAAPASLFHPVGCAACGQTGYRGRTMIVELMPMTDAIPPLVIRHAPASDLAAAAIAAGMRTMYDRGMRKVREGITTVEEVLRVTRDVA